MSTPPDTDAATKADPAGFYTDSLMRAFFHLALDSPVGYPKMTSARLRNDVAHVRQALHRVVREDFAGHQAEWRDAVRLPDGQPDPLVPEGLLRMLLAAQVTGSALKALRYYAQAAFPEWEPPGPDGAPA